MRIALVEDNIELAHGILYRLEDAGHAVDHLADGEQANRFLAGESADLIILDINLPNLSGLDVLRALRARGDDTPVLLLTARSEIADRVAGLDAGADDYLVKPFGMEELEARLRALSRRRPALQEQTASIGELIYDYQSRTLRSKTSGSDQTLPRRELAVFECLLENKARIVSKSQLLDYVYGIGSDVEEKVIEVYISRLRKRLSPHAVDIKSARGIGYMLHVPRDS